MWLKVFGSILFAVGLFGGLINAMANSETSGWWWVGIFVVGLMAFVVGRFQESGR